MLHVIFFFSKRYYATCGLAVLFFFFSTKLNLNVFFKFNESKSCEKSTTKAIEEEPNENSQYSYYHELYSIRSTKNICGDFNRIAYV